MRPWHVYRMLMRLTADTKCISKSFLPALIGLCLGITVSMMYAPFSDDSCETYIANQDPQKMIKLRDTKSLDSNLDDMYEPRVLSPDESSYKLDTKSSSKFYRPKFAATELGIKEKLFVGVFSSKDTLNTLAVAINKTLSHYVTKTVFFIDQKAPVVPPGMIIVNFDDGYNHLLPINVLKYVIKKYGHEYDYYMFVTDKGYVRAEKVFNLVSHLSVSKHVHMGSRKEVFEGKIFCSLDGGVIVSQSILAQVNASMKWCSDSCHHGDQSLNFGKCVVHVAQMECQSTVANAVYTAYATKNFNFNKDIEALKKNEDFNKSLAVYPMPDEFNHFKLHRYFCEVELNATRIEIQEMKDNILYMSQFAPGGPDGISWPIGTPESYKPKNRFDVIRWDYFTETDIFFPDDFTNVKELIGVDKLDIQDIIKISMEKLNEKHNNKYLYSYLVNGYRRFDPQRGMEYILDLALDDTSIPAEESGENNYNVRIVEKRVFLVRPLGEVEIVPMPYVTESTMINLILPVTVREMDGLSVFLENFASLQADADSNLALIIVFIYPQLPQPGGEDIFAVMKSMTTFYDDKNEDGVKTTMMDFASNGTFVAEYKIVDMVSSRLNSEALMFLCSIGMQINMEMLNRIRINTIPGWQVFFPIGYWQFKPNLIYDKKPYPSEIEFNAKCGHYDALSFEHASFYNSDYQEARKAVSETDLANYDIFEMFVKSSKLHVFRAVEPEFKHFFSAVECHPSSPTMLYDRCMERRAQSLATRSQLAKRIFQYQAKRDSQQQGPHHVAFGNL